MVPRLLVLVLLALVSAVPAGGQEPLTPERLTPNTLKLAADAPRPGASLPQMAWLAGRWTGSGLGGVTEETWSAPAAGAMMGMFRFLKGDQVVFYEFLTLVEHEGSLLLKLKHFNPDLTGWEEKADAIRFGLLKITPEAAWFDGLTFRRVGDNEVEIFLAIRNRADGSVREERFQMRRTP
jgi:hypothetical protein